MGDSYNNWWNKLSLTLLVLGTKELSTAPNTGDKRTFRTTFAAVSFEHHHFLFLYMYNPRMKVQKKYIYKIRKFLIEQIHVVYRRKRSIREPADLHVIHDRNLSSPLAFKLCHHVTLNSHNNFIKMFTTPSFS
jgi:hypothetical protein